MFDTVNHEFPVWQLESDQLRVYVEHHAAMRTVSKMADRITALIGDDSTREVAAKLALKGLVVSHTSVAKWKGGGDIEERNLTGLCEIYGSTPAYIRYGVKASDLPEELQATRDLINEKPEMIQEAFDFVRYKSQSYAISDPQGFSRYMSMIDKILRAVKK